MCTDVCTNLDNTYSCRCPEGKTLARNGVTCGGERLSLVIAGRFRWVKFSLSGLESIFRGLIFVVCLELDFCGLKFSF